MRYWEDGNFQGNDIESTNQPTLEDCMDRCIANDTCNAFTYDTQNRTAENCWLKIKSASIDDLNDEDYDGMTSGLHCNFQPFEEPNQPADAMYPSEGKLK